MSVAKVERSKFSGYTRKGGVTRTAELRCQKCRNEIKPGEEYRWYYKGFRSKFKNVRCMRAECTPRTSELESSNKADAYAAIENAEDTLDALAGDPGDASDIQAAVDTAAEEIDGVIEQYREAASNFGDSGTSAEIADELEGARDELQGFQVGDFDPEPCFAHTDATTALEEDPAFSEGDDLDAAREACDDCREKREEAWGDLIDEAREALAGVSF